MQNMFYYMPLLLLSGILQNMTKCAQKNKFIVPFTQLDRNAAPPIVNGKQTRPYTHGEWSPVHIERDEWSPVHIGRDIQSVTPSTKKKIKQRYVCMHYVNCLIGVDIKGLTNVIYH